MKWEIFFPKDLTTCVLTLDQRAHSYRGNREHEVNICFTALRAEELGSSSEQTKQHSEVEEEHVYTTLKENETERMWVIDSRNWSRQMIVTPAGVTVNSSSASEERLPKATVTISSVNGTCNVTLYCSNTGGGENVTYAWSFSHESVVLSEEQILHITQKPENSSLNYTCTIRNMESENSGTVSLIGHCHDAPLLSQQFSVSIYAKYWVPPLVVLVLLLILFLMYRRKRGRESLSRTVSINESSDSDAEDYPDMEQTAQMDPLPQAWKQIPEDSPQKTGAPAEENDEETLGTQDQPLNQE
ncbi:T-lymphocyte surface antigen Ly-9-like [Heteronotia binoei]|uniref:T-lymphocyte surface antigen Ly-9-like n=1 Tax=Heteronotia binoei TaxID=13085 RepID=UPI00292D58FD|nr:T-lymphocyte surface antigen Ly-9-like [Heteronotia binoei]